MVETLHTQFRCVNPFPKKFERPPVIHLCGGPRACLTLGGQTLAWEEPPLIALRFLHDPSLTRDY